MARTHTGSDGNGSGGQACIDPKLTQVRTDRAAHLARAITTASFVLPRSHGNQLITSHSTIAKPARILSDPPGCRPPGTIVGMGKLVFSMSVSLDGYVETPSRSLDWVHVDEELHRVFNAEAREMRTFLYGRRLYELMTGYWPTAASDPAATPAMLEFAEIWRMTPKVVFSTTLERVEWNSRLVRGDAVAEVARLKAQPGFDMGVGGPTLASTLIEAGLVDEFRVYVNPVILGAGTRFFPPLDERIALTLVEARTFDSGVVYLRYACGLSPACPAGERPE